jgi:hypothetical protein
MATPSETPLTTEASASEALTEADEMLELQPLTPSRKVELWTGRAAMVGFMTTLAAAISAT